jgi:hypothetical protein
MLLRSIAAAATLTAVGSAAWAHHSVSGQFDVSQQVVLTGVITEIDWINPHVYVHLDVTDGTGQVTSWRFATAPPAMMDRGGLTKEMMMGDGQPVVVEGYPARREGLNLGWVQKITYADGHYYLLSADRR